MGDVSRRVLGSVLVAAALVSTSCGAASGQHQDARVTLSKATPASTVAPRRAARAVRVVAVGDIACPAGRPVTPTQCQQGATASLARRLAPDLVLTLGDHQYDSASLAEFRASYAKSWGALLSRTRPTIGNHEYVTPGAAGYYSYFRGRQPGPPGYYRVRAGSWQIYLLNGNCDKTSCAREATWLNRQMRAHRSRCSLVTMHQPRFSSGFEHGNDPAVAPLWRVAYRHRNDLVLSGHDHDYERFVRMDAVGHLKPRRGMTEIVAGTGGASLYHLGTRKRGSVYYQARQFGVLELLLRPRSFSWAFRTIDGQTPDSGSRRCL